MHPVIEVSGVRKTYGKTVAVEDASFEVNQGEIFRLIGPSGARHAIWDLVRGIRERGKTVFTTSAMRSSASLTVAA